MIEAATNGHESCILTLVELGADVLEVDPGGWTLIHRAAQDGHASCVRMLVAIVEACDCRPKRKTAHMARTTKTTPNLEV